MTSIGPIFTGAGSLNVGGTSGARVVIAPNIIKVYDGNNVVRVRMGVWDDDYVWKALRIYQDDTALAMSEPSWCVVFNGQQTQENVKPLYRWLEENCDSDQNMVHSWGAQFWNESDALLCYITFK